MRHCRACVLLLFAGCLHPNPADGTVTCAASGQQCPDGYYCETASSTCWKNGDAPADMSAVFLDGGEGDSAAPPDLTQLRSNGQACASAGECASGFCADTVCCATDCTSVCTSCKVSGQEGSCVAVASGDSSPSGHTACTADTSNPCGDDGKCDGAGACRKQVLGTVCKAAVCNSGTNMITPQSTCDGHGSCQTPSMLSCAPYVCQNATSCWASCTGNAQCSGSNSCVSSSCGLKSNGTNCTTMAECMSGHCVDGVCCDQACGGICQYCKLSTSLGTCSLVPAGQDPRTVCPANGACVPGGCDGTKMACALNPTTTQCRPPSCTSNTETFAANCDATGACPTATTMPCAPYVCAASACKTMCANDGDCQTGLYCSGTTCVSQKALAQPCNADDQCTSGHCAPDGICCASACGGQCQYCESGTGACKYASGAPVSPRAACTGQGTAPCGGSCNGSSAACAYPTVGCGPAPNCYQAANQHYYVTGYGTCSSGTCQPPTDCGNYVCGSSCFIVQYCCKSSCTSDADCNTSLGYHCSGTTCQ